MGAVDDMDSGHLADTPSKQEFYFCISLAIREFFRSFCLHLAFFRQMFSCFMAKRDKYA